MRFLAVVVFLLPVFLVGGDLLSALKRETNPDAISKMKELAGLQGTWELQRKSGNQTLRSVKVIEGNGTTLQRFDGNGRLYWAHTSEFKLDVADRVRTFTFFNLEVTAGPSKGRKSNQESTFIYKVTGDKLVEARGLLADDGDEEPQLSVWTRVKTEEPVEKK